MMARILQQNQIWLVAKIMLLAGIAFIITRSIWIDIIGLGLTDDESSYILLVPFVAMWLLWIRRDRFRLCRVRGTFFAPLIISVGWVVAWLGFSYGVDIAWHLGGLIIVAGAVSAVTGVAVVRVFLPVAAALLFLIPVPGRIRQEIAIPLQEISAVVTQYVLEAFGLPIIREGNVLNINGYAVAVAEACNGMRMVSALGLVTFAFVFSVPMRQSVRVGFLMISPLVALIVNIVRLIPTVLVFGYRSYPTATMFHDVSGWVMLVVALLVLSCMLRLLRWLEIPVAPYSMARA